jgi:hypothetical protein
MKSVVLVYPMFAMVLLTFATLVRLFRARSASVASGAISASFFYLYQGTVEPDVSAKLSRHFINQFESPVLFYVGCLAALALKDATTDLVVLAWCYVILRMAHAWIHTGSNRLRPRIAAYMLSWVVLIWMWVTLVMRAASGPFS